MNRSMTIPRTLFLCNTADPNRRRISNVRLEKSRMKHLLTFLSPADVSESVTDHAIKSGYRHVDSATAYKNEEPTVKGMLKSGLPRDQLYFTSKVPPKEINYDGAKKCIDESLKKTGLGYIDLYLLHAPYGGKEGRIGAWRALVEAVEAGKVRSIGVSNYGVHHLDELEEWQKVCLAFVQLHVESADQ